MIPTRQKLIGENRVKEYKSTFWDNIPSIVYINDKLVDETYDQAVERLERGR